MKPLIKISQLSALVLACLFSACQSSATKASQSSQQQSANLQKIRLNIVSEPHQLDPRKARSLNDVNISKMFLEGLTRLNQEDEAIAAQAETIQVSEDGLTYTFKLRESQWSNGDPVLSSDFVYSWKKALAPDFPSDNAYQLFVIKNAKEIKNGELPASLLSVFCPDEKTLVVELEQPVPYFTKLTALPIFFPVHQQNDKKNPNWAASIETFMGNGPFKIETWTHHDRIVAVKNPGYWDQSHVKLDEIEMVMVSEDTGIKMFENQELDWEGSPFSSIPVDTIPHLKEQNKIQENAALATFFVSVNTEKKFLHSANLRKAFAHAVNRSELVNHALHGSQSPAITFVPPQMGLSPGELIQDGAKEKALDYLQAALEELGIQRTDLAGLKLSYPASDKMHRIAQVLQQQWLETLDLLVELNALEPKVYFSNISSHCYDLALASWFADFNDPINFLSIYSSKDHGNNRTGWEDAGFQNGIKQSYLEKNPLSRIQTLTHVEQCLIEALPIIPLSNGKFLSVKNDHVKDVLISGTGEIDFKWAHIEK